MSMPRHGSQPGRGVVHALEGDIRASAGERHRALPPHPVFSLSLSLSQQAWLLAFISLLRAIKHPSMAVSALFPFSFAFTQ